MPDLTDKRFCIFGLQGTGKSYLAKEVMRREPAHFCYDPLHEHQGFNGYEARYRSYRPEALAELNQIIARVIIGSGRVRLFVIDEANRYCPNKRPLPEKVSELNDFNRHYNIALGLIARRPVQLHTDLVELAHYLFIFNLPGKNDLAYLDSLRVGLGDVVQNLKEYHFVIVDRARRFEIHPPI